MNVTNGTGPNPGGAVGCTGDEITAGTGCAVGRCYYFDLVRPLHGASVITLGTVWIPPIWFAPLHFDACLNWTVHINIAALV